MGLAGTPSWRRALLRRQDERSAIRRILHSSEVWLWERVLRADPAYPVNRPQKNTKCGPASHRTAFARRIPCFCLVTAGRRNDRLGPTALPLEHRFCRSQLPIRDLAITSPQLSGGQQALVLLLRTGRGGRPQRPGNQFRACTRFRNVPRRFTLKNRRLSLALPQSFSRLRNAHVLLPTTLGVISPVRN